MCGQTWNLNKIKDCESCDEEFDSVMCLYCQQQLLNEVLPKNE